MMCVSSSGVLRMRVRLELEDADIAAQREGKQAIEKSTRCCL